MTTEGPTVGLHASPPGTDVIIPESERQGYFSCLCGFGKISPSPPLPTNYYLCCPREPESENWNVFIFNSFILKIKHKSQRVIILTLSNNICLPIITKNLGNLGTANVSEYFSHPTHSPFLISQDFYKEMLRTFINRDLCSAEWRVQLFL